MSNIQVTHDTSLENARSESSLAINPNNTQQIVAGSKKFIDYHNYDFTLATSYSSDGGLHWNDSAPFALLPGWTGISDPAIVWDDSGKCREKKACDSRENLIVSYAGGGTTGRIDGANLR